MDELINQEAYLDIKYQILGQECQALQVVLMPGQQLVTGANSVQFMSEKVHLRNKYSIRERFKQFFAGARKLDCIVQNSSESFGYVGLTQNQGRIVVIDQLARFMSLVMSEVERREQEKLMRHQ